MSVRSNRESKNDLDEGYTIERVSLKDIYSDEDDITNSKQSCLSTSTSLTQHRHRALNRRHRMSGVKLDRGSLGAETRKLIRAGGVTTSKDILLELAEMLDAESSDDGDHLDNTEHEELLINISENEESKKISKRPPLLMVYKHAPTVTRVDLATLEHIARHRLVILQHLFRQSWTELTVDNRQHLCRDINGALLEAGFHTWSQDFHERSTVILQDQLSHFILRLAFIEDPTAQEWFIQQESRLLHLKLWLITDPLRAEPGQVRDTKWIEALKDIMNVLEIKYEVIVRDPNSFNPESRSLWENIYKSLIEVALTKNRIKGPPECVLKVPFIPDAAPIVRGRRCYLKGGYGYVALPEIETVILTKFRKILLDSFKVLKERSSYYHNTILSDQQVAFLLKSLHQTYTGVPSGKKSTSQLAETLTITNIEQLSSRSFPPCMKHLYYKLKETKHLKHWGRLQLWLFLKGCGMTVDDQLHWWRSVWLDPDKFDKEIRYNIRHAYGKEGKRQSYSAFNCSKIISNSEYHGCPFRHFDVDPLKRLIQSYYKIPSLGAIDVIMELKKTHQYQLACQQLFKFTHRGSDSDGVGNHPNTYFAESCRHYLPVKGEDGSEINENQINKRNQANK